MTASSLRRFSSVAAGLLCFTLASCKSTKKTGDYSGVVDYTTPNTNLSQEEYPFDEQGNYLADVVSGKKRGTKNKKAAPPKVDPPKSYVDTYEKPPAPAVAAVPSPNYETPPASNPYAPVYSSGNAGSGSTAAKTKTSSSYGSSSGSAKPKSSSSSSKTTAKTKTKPKPKPKPQATTMSYTVKKGDTLYALANRYGTSVAAIKKASGLSSDLLRDGKTLKIPRK